MTEKIKEAVMNMFPNIEDSRASTFYEMCYYLTKDWMANPENFRIGLTIFLFGPVSPATLRGWSFLGTQFPKVC